MPQVTVRIPAWLSRGGNSEQGAMDEIGFSGPHVESVLGELRLFARGNEVLQRILQDRTFGIILNGRYVDPYDPSKTVLKSGDEIMLVPLLDGG